MNIENLFDLVPYNSTRRFDCPLCNGKNTLTITKEMGNTKYRCFKNSCTLHTGGSRLLKASKDDVLTSLASKTLLGGATEARRPFALPDYIVEGIPSKKAFQMLLNWNCIEAYTKGMFRVAYDPRSNRLVFLVQEDGVTVGAIGRALEKDIKPKVYNYPNAKPIPFTCGKGSTAVLVEDCFSACSIGRIEGYTGLALLGTSLHTEYLLHIARTYEKVIIALDPDAYGKSFKMKSSIEYFVQDTKVWKIPTDLKNMNKEQIIKFIEESRTPIII